MLTINEFESLIIRLKQWALVFTTGASDTVWETGSLLGYRDKKGKFFAAPNYSPNDTSDREVGDAIHSLNAICRGRMTDTGIYAEVANLLMHIEEGITFIPDRVHAQYLANREKITNFTNSREDQITGKIEDLCRSIAAEIAARDLDPLEYTARVINFGTHAKPRRIEREGQSIADIQKQIFLKSRQFLTMQHKPSDFDDARDHAAFTLSLLSRDVIPFSGRLSDADLAGHALNSLTYIQAATENYGQHLFPNRVQASIVAEAVPNAISTLKAKYPEITKPAAKTVAR